MYKLRKNNIKKNILKFVSGGMTLFFLFLSTCFAGEVSVTPFNRLNEWVSSAKKNLEINGGEGKAVVKNLYEKSLKQVELTKVNPMLESVKRTTMAFNNNYLCNIKDNDIANILYYNNDDFRKKLKSISSNFKKPTKQDMKDSCETLMTCILSGQTSKIIDGLSYCKMIVDDTYYNEYKNSYNLSTLSNGNKGSDAFRNKSLSDSSYDILNDVYILAKILFDSPEEPTEILFYDMPNIGQAETIYQPNVSVVPDWFSPYYQLEENSGGNNSGNNNGGDNSGTDPNNPTGPDVVVLGGLDDEILSRTTTYDIEGSEGYEFLGDSCISGFEIEGYDEESYDVTNTGSSSGSFLSELTEDVEQIVAAIANFICQYDANCNPNDLISGQTPGSPSGTGPDSGDDQEFDAQTLGCLRSCNDIPCTAKSCDRLACYAKCLCVNYESPFFDPAENPGLGPVFKLKFCIQPVQEHEVVTSQKVYTLESIINAISIVMDALRNSGELMLNKKTKEYLDAGFQKNNFGKQISFSIDGFQKVPESKGSEKQEKENQINLNTTLMETILGFDKAETANGNGRNKYIIKGGTVENGTITTSTSSSTEATQAGSSTENNNDTNIIGSLKQQHLANMGGEVSEFLRENVEFWQSLRDTIVSLNTVSKSLSEKK